MHDAGEKPKKKQGWIIGIFGACLLLVLMVGCNLWVQSHPADDAKQASVRPSATVTPSASPSPSVEAPVMLETVAAYYQENPDTVGHLRVPNTGIDYPVVYSGDNAFYLTHDFNKDSSEYGAIFLDFRCSLEDLSKTRNNIIYGHRMKDGSMFKPLTHYQNAQFFYDNRIIELDTRYEELHWEVFAVFIAHVDFYYIDTYFPTDEKWLSFLAECQSRSMFETDIELDAADIVLTLSTCAAKENQRLVVMARLIQD